jgi:hypothetical protein
MNNTLAATSIHHSEHRGRAAAIGEAVDLYSAVCTGVGRRDGQAQGVSPVRAQRKGDPWVAW